MSVKVRCPYVPANDALYIAYHDKEWCMPQHDDAKIYELFLLELFQAGLSWRTLLHKRENFRRAYAGFDAAKVAAFTAEDEVRLQQDAGIIRHAGKIHASIVNARVYLAIQQEWGSFAAYIWHFTAGKAIYEPLAVTRNALSDAVTRDLKKRGTKFAGTTSIYSFLQAIGIIYSHAPECFCYQRDGWGK